MILDIKLLKPASILYKNDIIKKTIEKWKTYSLGLGLTPDLSPTYSGFTLPMTAYWLSALSGNPFIHHHVARELEFVEDSGLLIGLRYKDSVPYWSSEEIRLLLDNLDGVINDLSSFSTPSLSTTHYFDYALPIHYKVDFTIKVINKARTTNVLHLLDQNFSAEGGFQLPLTPDWRVTLMNNPYIQYHSFREMRFVDNQQFIIGIRTKDGIPYWSPDEATTLLKICNDIIKTYGGIVPNSQFANVLNLNNVLNLSNILNPNTGQPYSTFEIDNVTFDRYKSRKIKFKKEITVKDKEKFMINIVKKAKKTNILKNLEINYSDDGGFYLPLTSVWKKYVDRNVKNRELEFIIKNNKITGLEFVEGIPLWTYDEVDEFLDIMQSVLKKLNNKS